MGHVSYVGRATNSRATVMIRLYVSKKKGGGSSQALKCIGFKWKRMTWMLL
jgi:hypothetical protein